LQELAMILKKPRTKRLYFKYWK